MHVEHNLVLTSDLEVGENLTVEGDILGLWSITARNISARNIMVKGIIATNIVAQAIGAESIKAHGIKADDIVARDILAHDIEAEDIACVHWVKWQPDSRALYRTLTLYSPSDLGTASVKEEQTQDK